MNVTVFCSVDYSKSHHTDYHDGFKNNSNLSKAPDIKLKTTQNEKPQKIENLFTILKNLNEQRFHKEIRSLVQECENKGAAYLKKVKTLELDSCNLTEISEDFSLMEKVSYLRLGNNNLSSLPDSLFSMADNLREIDIGSNQFRILPKVIYDIAMYRIKNKKYIEIYLGDNPIDVIPKQIKSVVCTLPHNGSLFSSFERDFPHIFSV